MRFALGFLTSLIVIGLIWSYIPERQHNPWGELADKFYIPLTYSNYDPEDFGRDPNVEFDHLLKQFRPRVYVAPGGLEPIDFYEDYLPHCVLKDARQGGAIVNFRPTRDTLKRVERSHELYLDYSGPENLKGSPVAYGRIHQQRVEFEGKTRPVNLPFIFLKYSFVFLKSGLPARLPWYKELFVSLSGDPEKWHELDLHGAVTVALLNDGDVQKPVALILAQHNYYRTYLFGRDIPIPKDGRPSISFALRSNEPYPAPMGLQPEEHLTVGNPSDFSVVVTGKGFAVTSGVDLVYGPESGAKEVDYQIQRLTSHDPLYVAWIPLGDRLKLFGLFPNVYRTGPPGINLFTCWPVLKEYGMIMKFWFADDGDTVAAELFENHLGGMDEIEIDPILNYTGHRFSEEFFKLHPEAIATLPN